MEIFLYFAFSGAWISRFSAPINLNSVCHEWRVVASSMPCLWQQIHIKLHCRRRGPNFKPLLTIFFNNSRSRNLEIKLPNPAKPPSLFERNIVYCQHQDLLKFIAPEMYRCQALSGYVSIQDICLLLSSSDREAETCLPSLKELDLAGCLRYNQDVGSFPFPIIFTTLSQILTKVILSDVSCFNMDERRLLQFLQCCPNLEYLSIGGVTVQYGTLLRLPIRYMKLHHLELRFPTNVPLPSSDFATRMLDRMPNLKHFSLSLTHRFCPGTQCSTDAALVSSYLTTCPERILGLLLPACLLANLRESIARQPGSQDLNLRLLAIHETGSLYFDYIMKKVKETLEHSATELILDRQWESNVEKIRTECLDCCYEEHHYSSGMRSFSQNIWI